MSPFLSSQVSSKRNAFHLPAHNYTVVHKCFYQFLSRICHAWFQFLNKCIVVCELVLVLPQEYLLSVSISICLTLTSHYSIIALLRSSPVCLCFFSFLFRLFCPFLLLPFPALPFSSFVPICPLGPPLFNMSSFHSFLSSSASFSFIALASLHFLPPKINMGLLCMAGF